MNSHDTRSGIASKTPPDLACSTPSVLAVISAETLGWDDLRASDLAAPDVVTVHQVGGRVAMTETRSLLGLDELAARRAAAASRVADGITRGAVLHYQTARSKRRMCAGYLRVVPALTAPGRRHSVGVFTYGRRSPSPKRAKNDLKRLFQFCRDRFGGLCYFQQLEAQRRNAPHFNIHFSIPEGTSPDNWRDLVQRHWLRITGTGGSSRYWRERKAVVWLDDCTEERAIAYFAKEFGKQQQKRFAKGTLPGRWWSVGGDKTGEALAAIEAGYERIEGLTGNDLEGYRERLIMLASLYVKQARRLFLVNRETGEIVRKWVPVKCWWLGAAARYLTGLDPGALDLVARAAVG